MKHTDVNYFISVLLLLSVVTTGVSGYIQSQLELRKFSPHRYFAYVTLFLAAVHVSLNIGKIWRFFRYRFKLKK